MNHESPINSPKAPALPSADRGDAVVFPRADLLLLLARHGLSHQRCLSGAQTPGTEAHLCSLTTGEDRSAVVIKVLRPFSDRAFGADTLARELLVLRAELPRLPKLIASTENAAGEVESVVRTFVPGASVVDLIRNGHLSSKDLGGALLSLLQGYEERGFVLSDTDPSNFIVAAEYGVVNPAAVQRALYLIDPEALSPKASALMIEGGIERQVKAILGSLERRSAAA